MHQPIVAARRQITRQAVLRAAGAASLFAPLLARPRQAATAGVVKVSAYDGFVPPAFKTQFETETGTEVRIRLAASQAPELTLLVAERRASADAISAPWRPTASTSSSRRGSSSRSTPRG